MWQRYPQETQQVPTVSPNFTLWPLNDRLNDISKAKVERAQAFATSGDPDASKLS
jgi:hypothetical protein